MNNTLKELIINVDGASRGNPGQAAIGVVISDRTGATLQTIARAIGKTTNNQAEYTALITGLETAISLGAETVTVFSDSELVVKQITGKYRVKKEELKPLYNRARQLMLQLKSCTIIHVPRERNREADRQANIALDSL